MAAVASVTAHGLAEGAFAHADWQPGKTLLHSKKLLRRCNNVGHVRCSLSGGMLIISAAASPALGAGHDSHALLLVLSGAGRGFLPVLIA
jgi:hypothetical protein